MILLVTLDKSLIYCLVLKYANSYQYVCYMNELKCLFNSFFKNCQCLPRFSSLSGCLFSLMYSKAKSVNIWCGTELGKRRGREESASCWSRGGRPGLRWRQPRTYCVSSKCPTTSWIVVCRYHSYYYSTIGLNSYQFLQVQRACIVLYFIISYILIHMKRSWFIQLVSASIISWLPFLC